MILQLKDFYQGKKVFVTGHTGFKGSWLCLWLKEMGAEVTAFSLPPEGVSMFELINLKQDVNSIFGDICHQKELTKAIKDAKPEIVIHMAAQALVRKSYREPLLTYQTNVIGTINLFEAVRKVGTVKSIVNITTDKCYENKELNVTFREDDKLGGHDPYSSSKACAEIVTSCWSDSFFAKDKIYLASARAGNVIGGGDFSEDRVIPDIIRAIESNNKVTLRSPNSTRPWQHVLEPLAGYLILAMKLFEEGKNFVGAYNFGPDKESIITVEDITKNFIKNIGQGSYQIIPDPNLYEAKTLRLDNNKAKEKLNWQPVLNFNKTIEYTGDWYKIYLNDKKYLRKFTLKQINQYIQSGNHDQSKD